MPRVFRRQRHGWCQMRHRVVVRQRGNELPGIEIVLVFFAFFLQSLHTTGVRAIIIVIVIGIIVVVTIVHHEFAVVVTVTSVTEIMIGIFGTRHHRDILIRIAAIPITLRHGHGFRVNRHGTSIHLRLLLVVIISIHVVLGVQKGKNGRKESVDLASDPRRGIRRRLAGHTILYILL
jgi:hypothetical protein